MISDSWRVFERGGKWCLLSERDSSLLKSVCAIADGVFVEADVRPVSRYGGRSCVSRRGCMSRALILIAAVVLLREFLRLGGGSLPRRLLRT